MSVERELGTGMLGRIVRKVINRGPADALHHRHQPPNRASQNCQVSRTTAIDGSSMHWSDTAGPVASDRFPFWKPVENQHVVPSGHHHTVNVQLDVDRVHPRHQSS